MATDWLGGLAQLGSGINTQVQLGNAKDNIKEGYDTAKKAVTEYQQPYQDYGLQSMQKEQSRPDFSFNGNDFEKDPSYNFLQQEGARNVQRSNAAQKMLQSGNTLATLQERGQNLASKEYQAAFTRAKDTYNINTDRNQFGMKTGADIAQNLGDNLADMGIGEGISMATLNGMQAKEMASLISSTVAAAGGNADPNSITAKVNEAISSGVGIATDWVKETVGGILGTGGAAAGAGAAGTGAAAAANAWEYGVGGVDAAMGAGAGSVTGVAAEQIGGKIASEMGKPVAEELASKAGFDLGGSSLASTGFASWAGYAAAGIGGIFALKSVVASIRGDSKFQSVSKKIAGSEDPLGAIQNLSSKDLPRDTRHSQNNSFKMSDSASRGALYSTVMKNMTPQDAQNLRQHQDFDKISNDLFEYAKSGAGYGGKNKTNPTQALIALYPSMKKDILLMAKGGGAKYNAAQSNLTSDDTGWASQMGQETRNQYYGAAAKKGREAERRVRDFMRSQGQLAGGQRNASTMVQEFQQQGWG